ncbi:MULTISPECIES: membrane protein insertase YidC [Cyanophyceae]|uniref:membrane protein insertase YidC n=1 Tax=Cyanophyceae TaxID=3028117 RepID=UPI00016DC578|nr:MULTISPECIES: membrane protein insertase YidC [Cyanophyceae]ACA98994.1 inner membrane protein YidC/OxaA [Picosynechococcus sp. PCC 7002]ANV86891.1 membrane protein insertase YidC [Picosynechococcus sp. PCC 7117]ANV90046.1 membrane protein insertase YidC [Picosynechococcus sp. PCC 8807]QCS49648.1 membrane protein insertase YidC [Picosynechococcus sp. PCC 11901]SMH35953.1 YidC/Oxa1 family membrane protein insertase [Picosynechococcus sp. OG1]
MDFGIGFLSNNVMLPILDFFYGIVPSYGFAIIALTLVIRFAVYPLSAKSIRSMRRTKITQPLMQKRVKEIQERYKNDPAKQQAAMSEVYKEFGNPLAGCLPILLQMPILFALFATLRGSPFANINYTANLQILPSEKMEQVQPQAVDVKTQNVYFDSGIHYPITLSLPAGNKVGVGETTQFVLQSDSGKDFAALAAEYPDSNIKPSFEVTKGQERVEIQPDGSLVALAPGDVSIQVTVPGIAADKGFLFIEALGRIGVNGDDGIHWDILGMVLFFGVSLYINQTISGGAPSSNNNSGGDQQQQAQQTVNKITPLIFSGMFLFFPLPAGVLMYMTIANAFQTVQTFILTKEPLPENLQKLVDEQEKSEKGRDKLPFERKGSKKKEKTSG